MRTIVKGKNVEVPDRVRAYAERKLGHIERLLDDRTDAIVELSNEHHRSVADAHIAEVTLVINGRTLHSHAAGASYQAAIDAVVDKVERQAVDHKEKPRLRAAARPRRSTSCRASPTGPSEPGHEPRIVKTKRFAIEPMFEEDAIAAMEELGHTFFVFVNAENERIAILYARADGDFGLIEPSVGGAYTPSQIDAGGGAPASAPGGSGGRRYSPLARVIRPPSTMYRRSAATSGWNSARRWLTSFSGYARSSVKQRSRR